MKILGRTTYILRSISVQLHIGEVAVEEAEVDSCRVCLLEAEGQYWSMNQ